MLVKIDGNIPGNYVTINTNSSLPDTCQSLTALGYGATLPNGQHMSNTLRQVGLRTVSNQDCKEFYYDYIGGLDSEIMMCSGNNDDDGGKDTCSGDSGGPILLFGTTIQVGIISNGVGCGKRGVPGVNTRVSAFDEWIHNTICTLSNYPPNRRG
jgi:secreted trypsin-like serine protease